MSPLFILVAIVGATQVVPAGQGTSASAIMFYLAAYGFATVGAFAIVTMVRNAAGEENTIAGWSGLAAKNPWVAGLFSLFMLSFAGIPLTGGFIGKWAVFTAAWRGGYWWLVVVAVLASLVAVYFYLRVIVVMFGGTAAKGVYVGNASAWTWIPVVIGAVATVWLGHDPQFDVAVAIKVLADNWSADPGIRDVTKGIAGEITEGGIDVGDRPFRIKYHNGIGRTVKETQVEFQAGPV